MANNKNPWIQTYSGKVFHLSKPHPDEIAIEDIARSLSQTCRFIGQTKMFYSVAEHSLLVSSLVPPEDALEGLLHSAPDAYYGSLAQPIKTGTPVGRPYRILRDRAMRAIRKKFHLKEKPESVIIANRVLFEHEARCLVGPLLPGWGNGDLTHVSFGDIKLCGLSMQEAESQFLVKFEELSWQREVSRKGAKERLQAPLFDAGGE